MSSGSMTQTRHTDGGQFYGAITDLIPDGGHWQGHWIDNKGTHRTLLIFLDPAAGRGRIEELGDHVTTQIWPGTLTVKGNHYTIDGDANGYDFGVNLILDE